MSKHLKISAISDLRTATDGRQYFVVSFSPGLGQKMVKRTIWQQFQNDPKTGLPLEDGKGNKVTYWERGSYQEFMSAMKSGEAIEGQKVTINVEPYEIGENLVDTYSTVVFPDENRLTVARQAGRTPIDPETGEILGSAAKASLADAVKQSEEVVEKF